MHDIEKANYIGNKRRFAEYIAKKFPEDGGTSLTHVADAPPCLSRPQERAIG